MARLERVDRVAIAVALAVATGLFYVPVLDAGFLNWDDPAFVTGNPRIRTLGWETVVWAFTTFAEGLWHPLTWLSLALDHAVYGLDPRGFHLTNLLLHVANTLLVFGTWGALTGAWGRSAVVAALFGLHPMHVESVAWVTERKDVLSTFFWLVTIGAYARYARTGTATSYAAVALAYFLGLCAKPMLVTLPFVLLLLDYWPLRRLSRRAVLEKVPLLALSALVSLVSVAAVASVREETAASAVPLAGTVANAVVSCVRYLVLTVWPVRLSPWYSHPWFEGPPLTAAAVVGSAALLVGLTALVVAQGRRRPYAAVGWLWFLGTLVPVLGLVPNAFHGMADRYAYVPHVGLFVAVTWAVADLTRPRTATARRAAAAALAVLLLALGVLTARQTRVWRDDATFWGYTARVNPHSFIAHQALAILMQSQGRLADASRLFGRAAAIRPDVARVHVQRARVLVRTGRTAEAAAALRRAVALEPDVAEHRVALAQALAARGRTASARRELERALALRPDHADARRALDALPAR